MWITTSKEAAVPLIAAVGVSRGRCERVSWGFSYRRVSMNTKPTRPVEWAVYNLAC